MNHPLKKDRAVGGLLGLAVGDAIGTTLEFSKRDAGEAVTEMIGGGPFGLKAGQWTDDTAMALCLADSLLHCVGLDERDLMQRFCRWWRKGENSCTGDCFDIGTATRTALARFERTGDPISGSVEPNTAGNGSLMRIVPVAIYWHTNRAKAADAARRQSTTTHAATLAVEACDFFTHVLLDAIEGEPKDWVLRRRQWSGEEALCSIANGAWRCKAREEIASSGYVIHTLEAALWSVWHASNFREAVLAAANLAGDADTVAAVAGQLAGSIWGASGIPDKWVAQLAWSERIRSVGEELFSSSLSAG